MQALELADKAVGVGNTEPHAVDPNLLPAAPTFAAREQAGLAMLEVEEVDTRGAGGPTSQECAYGRHSPSDAFERVQWVEELGLATDGSDLMQEHGLADEAVGVGNTEPCAVNPNLLPAAPTFAAREQAGLGVLRVEKVDTRGAGGPTSQECAYGRRSPSDAFERVQRVEELGLATDGSHQVQLDGFLANLMPSLIEFDKYHTDGMTLRDHNSEYFNWVQYQSRELLPNAMWACARDNGMPSIERKKAATADLALIDTYLKEGLKAEIAKHPAAVSSEIEFQVKCIRQRLLLIVHASHGRNSTGEGSNSQVEGVDSHSIVQEAAPAQRQGGQGLGDTLEQLQVEMAMAATAKDAPAARTGGSSQGGFGEGGGETGRGETGSGETGGGEDSGGEDSRGEDGGAEGGGGGSGGGETGGGETVDTRSAGGPFRIRNGEKKARISMRGFVNVPRDDFRRLQGNQRVIVNGNQRTCTQDALVHAAKVLGVCVTKKQVYNATLPAKGDTQMGVIIDYALSALGIQMDSVKVKETLGFPLFQVKGGAAFALLQQTEGVFVVEMRISQLGQDNDYHALVYDAGYTHIEYPGIRGAIIDNEKDTPIKFIEPCDRTSVQKARDVFHSLFPFASDVRVVGAWLMRRVPYPLE